MSSLPVLGAIGDETTNQLIGKIKKMYNYNKNYHSNRKELEKKREQLVAKKKDIDRQVDIGEQRLEQVTDTTSSWVNDVKEVTNDEKIRDLIDEEVRNASVISCFGSLVFNLPYRYKMSIFAEQKINEIKELITRAPETVTLPMKLADMESAPTGLLTGLKSREDLVVKILEKLRDGNVYSVALCGMGSIGKTTVAKEVKKKANGFFDLIAMAEVSEVPIVDRIQDQIAESIGLHLHDCCTTQLKATKLYTRLKDVKPKDKKERKILIIMDNVWHSLNLGDIGIPLERSQEFCCKILFTSRDKDVSRVMGVEGDNIMSLPLLTENEAEYLFRTRCGKIDDGGDFRTLEYRLLQKCGGLPLAIVATADALKAKSLTIWERFAKELESNQPSNEFQETYTILETSYSFIHGEDKKFFLLACLFPPGSKILIDDMMRYGIGLDLFQYVNKLSDAMDQAQKWVGELRSSALPQEDESEDYVKIHDVVRKSAISFAVKGGHNMIVEAAPRWLSKKTWAKYAAISLTSVHNYDCLRGLKCDMLEILLLHGDKVKNQKLEDDFFGGMTNLKVLVLTNMNFEEGLPKSIATLKDLKTLLLEECTLTDIELVGQLESLLVLSFRGSKMKELPKEIGNLYNLRVLDLWRCVSKPRISADIIAKLSHLEGLFVCESFVEWAHVEAESSSITTTTATEEPNKDLICQDESRSQASVAELNNLSCLDVLEMHIPYTTQLPTSGQFVKNLSKFRMSVGLEDKLIKFRPDLGYQYSVVPSPLYLLLPSRMLIIHHMKYHHVLKYTWLNVLIQKTEFLRLSNISGLKSLAHELQYDGFKSLKHLHVEGCNDMHCVVSSARLSTMTVFPILESLFLSSMSMLKFICDGVATSGLFSNLRDVSLKSLTGLQTYALPMNLARQLTSIKVEDCENLNFIFGGNASDREDESCTTTSLAFLKKLILVDLPKLHNLIGEANSSNASDHPQCQHLLHKGILLSSLEELELRNVPIRELWDSPPNQKTGTDDGALAYSGSNIPYFDSLQNLKCVTIEYCDELESLGVPSVASYFLQMERLKIHNCTKMSQVLSQERDGEMLKPSIIFPSLRGLTLDQLPCLRSFYEGNHRLQFSALERLEMAGLPRIVSVAISGNSMAFFNEKIEFPSLFLLELSYIRQEVDEVKELWRPTAISNPLPQLFALELDNIRGLQLIPAIAFEQLSSLELSRCDNKYLFSTSMPSTEEASVLPQNQMSKLETLYLHRNELMEDLFRNNPVESTNENDAVKKIFSQLRTLEVFYVDKMNVIPLQLFQNLHSLTINVKWECLFTSELVTCGAGQLFPLLEELTVSGGDNLKTVLDDEFGDGEDISPQVIEFPRLQRIFIESLEQARSFNSRAKSTLLFPSLEELHSFNSNLESVFSGNVIAPKLRVIYLDRCRKMTMVFNATELPCLMILSIVKCPHLQTFSEEHLEALLLNKVKVDSREYLLEHMDFANHPINSFLENLHKERMLTMKPPEDERMEEMFGVWI